MPGASVQKRSGSPPPNPTPIREAIAQDWGSFLIGASTLNESSDARRVDSWARPQLRPPKRRVLA